MSKLNKNNGFSYQSYHVNYFIMINSLTFPPLKMRKEFVFLPGNMELDIVYRPCPRYLDISYNRYNYCLPNCNQVDSSLVPIDIYFILLYFIFLHKYAGMETKGVVS